MNEGGAAVKPGSPIGRYLLYAIGEIALVVIGILIALQINNWNEWKKDRVKERNVLTEIRATLNENVQTLNKAILQMEKGSRSSQVVISFLNGETPYSDTLSFHFDRSRWSIGSLAEGLSDAGYKEIENSGFDIISNMDLKKDIVKYFDKSMPQLISKFTMNNNGVFANYDEYTRRHFKDLGGPRALPLDPDQISNDNYYRSIITTIYDSRNGLMRRTESFINQSEQLIGHITETLDIE